MNDFTFKALPWNIVFGAGALARLPAEMETLGLGDALVLATPGRAEQGCRIVELLGDRAAGLFAEARMHVPALTLDRAAAAAKDARAKCTVAIGGGSTTGLGKALAARVGLPNVVVPTTYSGSEMTSIWAVTEEGRKSTARDPKVVPTLTLYDPELTVSLPPKTSAASGLNAMAQAVVNVATDKQNPIVVSLGLDGIRALARSLPRVVDQPDDIQARSEALYGACLAAGAIGVGTTSLHHRLCHTFGGAFDTPHAETHAVLLPHSVAYNARAAEAGTRQVAEAIGAANAARGIHDLAKRLGAPTSLREIGVEESDLDHAAQIATASPINNPEPVTVERVRALLANAFYGAAPSPT